MSKNVEIFCGAPINRERIIDKVLRSTRSRRGMGFILHVCYGDSPKNGMLCYSSLIILGGYVIKRSHPSLDLNGSKIHTIYLVEFLMQRLMT